VTGGSTPVDGEELVASELGGLASALDGAPESGGVVASGFLRIDASAAGIGGLPEVPPDEPVPLPELDELDEPGRFDEPDEAPWLNPGAEPELLPPAPEPGDSPVLGELLPHAAMTIATPTHDRDGLIHTLTSNRKWIGCQWTIRHGIRHAAGRTTRLLQIK